MAPITLFFFKRCMHYLMQKPFVFSYVRFMATEAVSTFCRNITVSFYKFRIILICMTDITQFLSLSCQQPSLICIVRRMTFLAITVGNRLMDNDIFSL